MRKLLPHNEKVTFFMHTQYIDLGDHFHDFHEFGHFDRCLQHVKFISFCNNAAMKVVIERYPNLSNRCHLIYHGIDTDF